MRFARSRGKSSNSSVRNISRDLMGSDKRSFLKFSQKHLGGLAIEDLELGLLQESHVRRKVLDFHRLESRHHASQDRFDDRISEGKPGFAQAELLLFEFVLRIVAVLGLELFELGFVKRCFAQLLRHLALVADLLALGSEDVANEMDLVRDVIAALRNIRGENRIKPGVAIHAKLARLDDGGFAKVTTESGSAILKVSISEGQQHGTIFTPIHWSDATAAHARIGDMVTAAADPFSGQPDLKATPARVEPMTFAYRGFALSRGEITPPSEAWFARAAVVGGDGLLFASNELPEAWRDFARQQMPSDCEITEHIDPERGVVRVAAFRSGHLEACIFLGPAHAPPQWDAMRALFEAGELDESERLILLSERGDEGRIDNGPVICACFGVRLAAIRDALETGIAADVADIGRTLRAGTNCGSCVPELRGIIEKAAQAV